MHDEDGPPGGVAGTTASAYDGVRAVFGDVIARQSGTGAAFAVWRDGELVVDLWGGWADAVRTTPFQRNSLVMPYSVAKPFAAICVLRLVDRGLVDLDDDVRRTWPEMRTTMTVRQLLCHQSGLVFLDEPAPPELFFDWDGLCSRLASQPPAWTPGTAHGESALFYGHPLGQVVRGVDGRTLGTYLREEICDPLDLDFHVGLPGSEHDRVVELTGFETVLREGDDGLSPTRARALGNPPGALDGAVVNSPQWRSAEMPAVNGHGTARAVAAFYGALMEGRVISKELLAEATSPVSVGVDRVLETENAWGLGFAVDVDEGFGMGGIGGNLGWWSTSGEYAVGYVTGSLDGYDAVAALETAVRDVLGLPAV